MVALSFYYMLHCSLLLVLLQFSHNFNLEIHSYWKLLLQVINKEEVLWK